MEIQIQQDLFAKEAELAEKNKALFKELGLMVINLLGPPGAGKTNIIRQTGRLLKMPMAVIEGDPASSIDTDLLNSEGIPAFQINTEGVCHLEAGMIAKALQDFKLSSGTILFIENIGNLICTASYPLGEALRVVVVGASEGDDKPFKYPDIFQHSNAIILNKIDLQSMVDFNRERFYRGVQSLQTKLPVFEISCKTEVGLDAWANWLAVKFGAFWAG